MIDLAFEKNFHFLSLAKCCFLLNKINFTLTNWYFFLLFPVIAKQKETSLRPDRFGIAVLSFDEMSVSKIHEFDQENQQFLKPSSHVQVMMLRGLLESWKSPVYYNFDENMSKDTLFKVIKKAEEIGIYVFAIVSDMGTSNVGLWKELKVAFDGRCFFDWEGEKNRRIYVFADVPHLIKLLRNHFLDSGFLLPGGEEMVKNDLINLKRIDSGETQLLHKLTPLHFTCSGSERQRVFLATQLFSHSVASALRCVFPEKTVQADFIQLINDWFDIMDSRMRLGNKNLNCALGIKFDQQREILGQVIETIQNLQVKDSKSKLPKPWQKGMILSTKSVLGLFEDLQRNENVRFIFTSRLNQDLVENLFSRLRYIGGADNHPSPLQFKNRFRLLCLGKSADIIVENAAVKCSEDIESEILSESVMKSLEEKRKNEVVVQKKRQRRKKNEPEISTQIDSVEEIPDDEFDSEMLHILEGVDCELESKKYIAGYIGFKLQKEHPELTETQSTCEEEKLECEWIDSVSYGGLLKPTKTWFNQVSKFDQVFLRFHGEEFDSGTRVIDRLVILLQKEFPHMPEDVIKFYSRIRTFFRLKHLKRLEKTRSAAARNAKKMRQFKK